MKLSNVVLSVFVVVSAIGVYKSWREGRFAKVPEPLKEFVCQDSSLNAPVVIRLQDDVLILPCLARDKPSYRVADLQGQVADRPGGASYYFQKTTDGKFQKPSQYAIAPDARVARYNVEFSVGLALPGPRGAEENGWTLKVSTPVVFAAAGPETTFTCINAHQRGSWGNSCVARARSQQSLNWLIQVNFSDARPDASGEYVTDFDRRPDVIEAYNMVATMVVR